MFKFFFTEINKLVIFGAGEVIRTLDFNLGKAANEPTWNKEVKYSVDFKIGKITL